MLLEWKGQMYVIKSTAIKYDGSIVTNEVVAKHIFMEFQNHYIQKDLESEELNGEESTGEETKTTMTLEQYLDFGFKGNKLDFSYEIKGDFKDRKPVEELGNKMVWNILLKVQMYLIIFILRIIKRFTFMINRRFIKCQICL